MCVRVRACFQCGTRIAICANPNPAMARIFAVRCLLLCALTTCVLGSHFRGAIFMVRPSPGGGENEMEVFFYMTWDRRWGFCNQSVIDSGNLIDNSGSIVCQHGCSSQYAISNTKFRCTAFSIGERRFNWSFGERRFTYTFNEGPDITIAFTGNAWLGFDQWSILTYFSTAKRNDTGHINSTPRAITTPLLRLQANCNHTIKIPVNDPDNDIVRCRWAVGEAECHSVCDAFPKAVLDPESCSIMYTADQGVGYRAAAIMIEDFPPGSTVPMSSVGLQFLVLVFSSNRLCSDAPEFIPPTPEDDSCVAIPPGGTFHTMLVAVSGNENDTITEIQTVSPAGIEKSDLFHDEDSNVFHVNITWTPTTEQENDIQLFCFTASNSAGLSSSQVCIELLTKYTAPAPIPETAVPTINMGLVYLFGTTWRVDFDRNVGRPLTSAYITFHEFDTDVVVHKIDTSLSSEVVFANDSMIVLTPDHIFEENREFYINFDRGAVIGVEGCRLGNEPVTGRQFWTFKTLNVTLPKRPDETSVCVCETPVYKTPVCTTPVYETPVCVCETTVSNRDTLECETPDCTKCENFDYETPDSQCDRTSYTTTFIIGAIVGIIGLLMGASGLIIACVTIKKRRVSDGKAGVTTEDNPAYGLNSFHKRHGKTGDEYDYVQSSPAAAAPKETVYERVS